MKVVEVKHPLIQHKLGLMRKADISTKHFRELAREVASLLTYEATKGLFNGSQKIFIHVSGHKEITDAVTMFKDLGITDMVVVHGDGAEKVASLLIKHNIPVVVERAHRIPENEDDDYDLSYRNAAILIDAGLTVAISMEGQMERMNTRNLPFYAGTYAAHGVEKEEAVAKQIAMQEARIKALEADVER